MRHHRLPICLLSALAVLPLGAAARSAEVAHEQNAAADRSWSQSLADVWRRLFGLETEQADDAVFKGAAAEQHTPAAPTSFDDIVGGSEAKLALQQFVQAIEQPATQGLLAAAPARGILLVGPPGVGKTLLARATLAAVSGSATVHVTSGPALTADDGSLRGIADLFSEAGAHAPAVIFIDELDVLAYSPAHSKALGLAIDGYAGHRDIYVIAAVNSLDRLDPSLLRAGRFDQIVHVQLPNAAARQQLLQRRSENIAQADDVDLRDIAAFTAGLSGADLVNLVNLATARAARAGKTQVAYADWDEAYDDIRYGPPDLSRAHQGTDRYRTAVHEAGHAAVALLTGPPKSVRKVSLVPRYNADGYTDMLASDEPPTLDRPYWQARIAVALAGHAAETYLLGEVTPGASSDLQLAWMQARAMVSTWGMHHAVGPMGLPWANSPFDVNILSEETKQQLDRACRDLVDDGYAQAAQLVKTHSGAITSLAKALLQCTSLSGEEAAAAMAGSPPSRCSHPAGQN